MDNFTNNLIKGAGVATGVVLVLVVAGKLLPPTSTSGILRSL
jgi:hypothetical protein